MTNNPDYLDKMGLKVLKWILYIILGIAGVLLENYTDFFVEKSDVLFDFNTVTIDKDNDGNWSVIANLSVTNRSNQKTGVEIKGIILEFDSTEIKTYNIPLKDVLTIDGMSSKNNIEIKGIFLDHFDKVKGMPKLRSAKIVVQDFSKSEADTVSKYSISIDNAVTFRIRANAEDTNLVSIDGKLKPIDSIPLSAWGDYSLILHSKKYSIKYYPNNYPVKHIIRNGRIILSPDLRVPVSEVKKRGGKMSIPFITCIRTSKEIAKYIDVPQNIYMRVVQKDTVNGEIYIKKFEVATNEKEASFVYKFD